MLNLFHIDTVLFYDELMFLVFFYSEGLSADVFHPLTPHQAH